MPPGSTPHIYLPYRRMRTSRLLRVSTGDTSAVKRRRLRMANRLLPREGNGVRMAAREESPASHRRRQRHPVAAGCLCFSLQLRPGCLPEVEHGYPSVRHTSTCYLAHCVQADARTKKLGSTPGDRGDNGATVWSMGTPGMALSEAHMPQGRLINLMESRLRIAGQAVHPVLVMFPLGLFAIAVFFDIGNLLGGPDMLGALAYWNIVAGLIGGILVALANAVDLVFVRNGTRAKRLGVLISLVNMGVLILFAVIL